MKKLLKKTFTLLFITTILLGFAMPLNPVGNWYQQFMPNLSGAQITDVTFLDSLTGYAVTGLRTGNDSAYILKTTNGGDNWDIKFMHNRAFVRVQFINANTGFTNAFTRIYKTTDAGGSWLPVNLPGIFGDDMFVLSQDTIWLAMSESSSGGVFRTTNGGGVWQPQLNIGSQNPEKIYMFNARIGFISKDMGSQGYVRKTTDGGATWSLIVTNDYYRQIHFVDSLTGWKCSVFGMKKTTDGGLSWVTQPIPTGPNINSAVLDFSVINRDTLWGSGGTIIFPNSTIKSILYRTVNGGTTWQFQIPDTSVIATQYFHIQFKDKLKGWAYGIEPRGIHTTKGGDTQFITGITQNNSSIPNNFALYQNYPNPFNPVTKIKFDLSYKSIARISLFNVQGKEITILVNNEMDAGSYSVDWDATNYPSGVYFYKLTAGKFSETKKMILIK